MDSKEQVTLYEKARKRAVAKKYVYYHFVIFLIGSVFLIVLNTVFNVGIHYGEWFKYAVAIWLFIWIFHFVNVFITHRFFGKEWVQNETAKLMAKHESKVKQLEKELQKKGVLKSEHPTTSSTHTAPVNTEETPRSKTSKSAAKKHITLIAAIGKNGELGKNNELIWHLPNDLKRFKKITAGHDVIMGRKTFESLGKPLPQRTNIVVTRNTEFHANGCLIAHSLEEALTLSTDQHPYILGGAQIYTQAIKIADVLDLTLVNASLEADAHFPKIDNTIWKETSRENFSADHKHQYNYSFVRMERKS